MNIQFQWNEKTYQSALDKGIDISISYKEDFNQVNCFYAPFFNSSPVTMGSFVGSVSKGSPVNFYNSLINIHGNGTHTECAGHILLERNSVNGMFADFFGITQLLSVYPTKMENGDRVITAESLEILWTEDFTTDFLVIRTLPNTDTKKTMHYSGTNPPYIAGEAIRFLVSKGIKHLLVDLPSVDKEEDGGLLIAHKTFWEGNRVKDCTITELIYVPDTLKDGYYLINLQMAAIEQDAAPSRPVLFEIYE